MRQKRYNKTAMKEYGTIIVGGGAAGLFCAAALRSGKGVLLLERGERTGRKLSATGNGQGNVTNLHMSSAHYFHQRGDEGGMTARLLSAHGERDMIAFLERLGGIFLPDARGRVYPAGRQASAVTDLLRRAAEANGVFLKTKCRVVSLRERKGQGFVVEAETDAGKEQFSARRVVLCTGGKAAPNFGTDGSAYALAKALGHTVTSLYPSLVQLKTERDPIRGLKGVRTEAALSVRLRDGNAVTERGDVIFTDYGISGDAVFRLSAFLTDQPGGKTVWLEFVPDVPEEKIAAVLRRKRETYSDLPAEELPGGIVCNALGRAIVRRCGEKTPEAIARAVKAFPLAVTGSLGFESAQVTKGGIPLDETDGNLQSRLVKGLYFAGEILDADGQCGGYNLQWAYSSARAVADRIDAVCASGEER